MSLETKSNQMYSLIEWDMELRTKFYLPYDPYYYGDDTEKLQSATSSKNYLRQLGVFFFRDDDHAIGLLQRPTTKNVPEMIQDGEQFHCEDPLPVFVFMCEVTYPVMEFIEWDKPKDAAEAQKYERVINRYGDAKKWLRFNHEMLLVKATTGMITTYS